MKYSELILPEFDQEMAVTRRVIERVPSEIGEWRPHEKSFRLAHLAQLVAWMPGWITNALTEKDLDLGKGAGYTSETTETLLKSFDKAVAGARAAIADVKEDALDEKWVLKNGDMELWKETRRNVVRSHINHLVHHRGQLTVYLRLLDVPVPSIYGPSADERPF